MKPFLIAVEIERTEVVDIIVKVNAEDEHEASNIAVRETQRRFRGKLSYEVFKDDYISGDWEESHLAVNGLSSSDLGDLDSYSVDLDLTEVLP